MSLTVRVIAWNDLEALAIVAGSRVRVRRNPSGHARWICQRCGRGGEDTCPHTRALAAATPPPEQYRHRRDLNP